MRTSFTPRALLAATLLFWVAGVHAQNITVTAANASRIQAGIVMTALCGLPGTDQAFARRSWLATFSILSK